MNGECRDLAGSFRVPEHHTERDASIFSQTKETNQTFRKAPTIWTVSVKRSSQRLLKGGAA